MRKGPTGQGLISGYTEEDECSGSWFVVRRTSAVLPIWRPPLHSDLSRHLLRAAPGGALQPALWAWCPGFFIHRNVQFFISCTYTCNKKQKQKTKKKPQTNPKNIGANSYIWQKRAAEKGVSCLFNAGQSFSGEDDLLTSSGRAFSDRRKKACGWLTGSWDPSFKKPVVLCYLLEKSWHLWLLKGWICVTCAACFFMLLRRCLPGKWCSLGQRRNSIASWYTCFTVIGLDVLSMRGTVWHTELTC